jgi:hypothetical protein
VAEPSNIDPAQPQQPVRELRATIDKLELGSQSEGSSASHNKNEVSPLLLTILGAIGTGILAISNSFFQAKQAHDLEQDKLRSTLILKAIESPDANERKKALAFYVEAGLLSDPGGKISAIKPESIPQAPESKGQFLERIGYSDITRVGEAIVFSAGMFIDPDGAPRAYHPDGKSGLAFLGNIGKPGNWWGLVTADGTPRGKPVVQGAGDPAPGYYISTTALQDESKAKTDPRRYVDSSTIPYIVLPARLTGNVGEKLGDLSAVYNRSSGNLGFAVLADFGPSNFIGGGSIALAESLGLPSNPNTGGVARGITYLVFPGSGGAWPKTVEEIDREGAKLFQAWGGLDRLKRESQ